MPGQIYVIVCTRGYHYNKAVIWNKKIYFPFNNRDFTSLWLGQAFSQLGDAVFNIAITWFILSLQNSVEVLAKTMIILHASHLAAFVLSGPLVDRFDRRKIMLYTDLLRGALVLILGLYAFNQELKIWNLYLLTFIDGILTALFSSAKIAIVPSIVAREDFARANALNTSAASICGMMGPAVGGLLISLPAVGFSGASMINSATFLLSALGISLIRPSHRGTTTNEISEGLWASFANGFKYAVSDRGVLRILLYYALLSFLSTPIFLLLALFAKDVLNVDATGLGLIDTTWFAGGLLGASLAGVMGKKYRRGVYVVCLFIAEGIAFIFITMSGHMAAAMAAVFIYGWVAAMSAILLRSHLQGIVRDEYRGRFFSFMYLITDGLTPVAMGLTGFAAGTFGTVTVMMWSGVCFTIIALSGFFIREIRKIND